MVKNKTYFFYICLIFALFTHVGCGDGGNHSTDTNAEPGSIVFDLAWESPNGSSISNAMVFHAASTDVCTDYGITTINAYILDSLNATVTSGTWACSAHGGTLAAVTAGANYTVRVEGVVSGGSVMWQGEVTGVSVIAGQTTNVGQITMTYIGDGADAFEPNDSFATASAALVSGNAIAAKIGDGTDEDYYAITVATPGIISINMAPPSNMDYDLWLFNSNQVIVEFSDNTTGSAETISHSADPGMYYIKVFSFNGVFDATNTYSLIATWQTSGSAPAPPTGVTATGGDTVATISWDNVSGATSYNIYLASVSGVTKDNYSSIAGGRMFPGVTNPQGFINMTNGHTYYIVVTAVNSYGESEGSNEVSVTPFATADTTPPTVSSTNPANNATGVAVNSAITATFSETMTASTVNTSTFTLNNGVTGTVRYSGTTATFTPSSNLAYSTTYTATITTGVKDAAGNAMAGNYIWIFTTGTATQGPNVSLPKTGQTTSYGAGDDGDLEKGVAWPNPRFTVGTGAEADCVTDNLTGLMWVKSPDSVTRIWADALAYADGLTLCGHTDWRLPNVNELESLVNAEQVNTATWLNTQGFSNVQDFSYWSSTTYAYNAVYAWYVSMYDGYVYNNVIKTHYTYMWPVRSGSYAAPADVPETGQTTSYVAGDDGDLEKGVAWPNPRFTVGTGAEAACVTDNLTGLMWVKSPDSVARIWADALAYADGLTLCGYTDWRLPNRKELRSLVNYGQSNTATWLNTQGFSNAQAYSYPSSTTDANRADNVWGVNMYDGSSDGNNKTYSKYIWPVRAGQ